MKLFTPLSFLLFIKLYLQLTFKLYCEKCFHGSLSVFTALRALQAFGCFNLGSAEDGKIVNAMYPSETGGSSPSVLFSKNPQNNFG